MDKVELEGLLRMASLTGGLLLTAFWCYVAWAFIHHGAHERRLRRELPAKIKARAFRCPICGDTLPAWGGVFENCPADPVHATYASGGTEKGGGPPESSFRLGCARCDRDIWFSAWLDGTVRLHFGWLWEVSNGCEDNWRQFIFP
jgi:hypothetical protein